MPVTLVFPVESNNQLILLTKYQKYLYVSTGELAYKQDIGRAIDCPVRIAYYWKPDLHDAARRIHCQILLFLLLLSIGTASIY
jgi:hypothetical protein